MEAYCKGGQGTPWAVAPQNKKTARHAKGIALDTHTHTRTTYCWFSLYKWRCCWLWILFHFYIRDLMDVYKKKLVSIPR